MILVTGCTGYIGSHLTKKLLHIGKAVRGLVLPQEREHATELADAGMEIWPGDLLIPATLQGITTNVNIIYHLAGIHGATIQHIENVYVRGTHNLIQICASSHIQACVIASNSAVYGNCNDDWLTEASPLHTVHPFGHITLQMESVLMDAYHSSGFPSIILRIAEVYGPGKRNVLQSFPTRLLGDGNNWNSYIHIDDLLSVLEKAPYSLFTGQVYNVVDNLPMRAKDFYNATATFLGTSPPEWLPLEAMPDRIKLSLHGLRSLSIRLSNTKIKALLHDFPRYTTYIEALQTLKALLP